MAREHARILCRIWRDTDFKALSVDEQWLYEALLSQPTISNAGVLALTPRSWSRLSADMTLERVQAALAGLSTKRYVVIDEDTDEALVRTFMRNDGVSSNGKVFQNALKVALQVQSEALRHVLAVELRKVGTDNAHQAADILDPQTPDSGPSDPKSEGGKGNSVSPAIVDQKKSERPQKSCGVGEGVGEVVKSPSVVVSVGAPSPAKPTPDRRGTRIPEDFTVTASMRRWATGNVPSLDVETHTANFIDFWIAKPGKDGRKLDWARTWQRWMRTEQDRAPGRSKATSPPATPTGDLAEWLRGLWQTGDVEPIQRATRLKYEHPDLPADIAGRQAVADYFRDRKRDWIESHRDEILAQLSKDTAA
jgi:hypothetical protein